VKWSLYRSSFANKCLSQTADDAVPQPVVLIDQDSDRDATIVQLSFGDRLGALLDTVCIFLMLCVPFTLADMLKILFVSSRFGVCVHYCVVVFTVLQMKALKDLGLDVTKGTVATDSSVTQTKFHIMRSWVHATFCLLHFLIKRLVVCLNLEK
jgi:hypothetical protein